MTKNINIKPGDKIYIPIYDDVWPEESYIGAEEIFDVGEKGIYHNCNEGWAEFLSFDEAGKVFFVTKEEAEKELLCKIARE